MLLEHHRNGSCGPTANAAASSPRSNRSTPVPPSSKPTRPTTIPPTKTKTKSPPSRPAASGSSFSVAGPNRIGQGIEFDYCCCHASFALRELGIESVMVNSNPETVSTDYDTSDLLVLRAAHGRRRAKYLRSRAARRRDRAIRRPNAAEFGPRTCPRPACRSSAPVSTRSKMPKTAKNFSTFCSDSVCASPPTVSPARWTRPASKRRELAIRTWFGPALCSAAGRWKSATTNRNWSGSWPTAFVVSQGQPVLIDRFLEDAIEVDVDAIGDGQRVIVAGIMEHIEEAGVHSGDSACALPPYSLSGPNPARNSRRYHARWPSTCAWSG